MIIANRLRTTNRAEYILYMWQVEDLLRSFHFDLDHLREHYLANFQLDDAVRRQTEQWYEDLARMMVEEGIRERGHLQIVRNALNDLGDMHRRLLASEKFPYYKGMYYKVLPYIVELRAKNAASPGAQDASGEDELETLFNALYGTLLLRLQHREVTPETRKAMQDISTLLGQLSDYYLKDREEPLEL
ncbi:MAG: DUF4924 family protein [Alloprevotella sp.]|nr:DUF4924 family protein [Alloprevotella sp.]